MRDVRRTGRDCHRLCGSPGIPTDAFHEAQGEACLSRLGRHMAYEERRMRDDVFRCGLRLLRPASDHAGRPVS